MPYTELAKAIRATIAPVAAKVINVIWARREAQREAAAAVAAEEDAVRSGAFRGGKGAAHAHPRAV